MGGMNLFGMGPGQLDELQRLRRQKMEADTLAQRTQGLSPARARAYGVGFRAAGGIGNALGMFDQQEDTDITQARAVQRAANSLAQTPEFQKMNPFEKRAALAQAQAAELARMGNVQLANQFYEMAGKAQSEGALLGTREAQLSAAARKQEQQELLSSSMENLQGSRQFQNLDPSEQFRRASEETIRVALETNDINLYQNTAKELANFDRQERNAAAQEGERALRTQKLRQELGIVVENGKK